MGLSHLRAEGIKPFGRFDIEFAPRVNLITGDNGLGKSLILDLAFWRLSGTWPHRQILMPAEATARVEASCGPFRLPSASFRRTHTDWTEDLGSVEPAAAGWLEHGLLARALTRRSLVLFMLANGQFAIFDPLRHPLKSSAAAIEGELPALTLSSEEVWSGRASEDGVILCNGLVRDWVSWQREGREEFRLLEAVLARLSPSPDEELRAGAPRAWHPDDDRDFPTLLMPYGEIFATQASEAVRRMLALAYLMVWTFTRHRRAAELRGLQPLQDMVVLIDEVEAHLHPRWQRRILPALMEAIGELGDIRLTQVLAVTHSPLVLASLESFFDPARDRLFSIDQIERDGRVEAQVQALSFHKRGSAERWLLSEVFDLGSTYGPEAASAIDRADQWLDSADHDPTLRDKVEAELRERLSETDPYWAHWRYTTQKLARLTPDQRDDLTA